VKQEQEDHFKSCANDKKSIEALDRTIVTLRQIIKDLEGPIKRKGGISVDIDEEMWRHQTLPILLQGRSIGGITPPPPAPPPPPPPPQDGPITYITQVKPAPPVKKEPQNLLHPSKFDGTSSKLEELVPKVDNIFEGMLLSYNTTSEKILYISNL